MRYKYFEHQSTTHMPMASNGATTSTNNAPGSSKSSRRSLTRSIYRVLSLPHSRKPVRPGRVTDVTAVQSGGSNSSKLDRFRLEATRSQLRALELRQRSPALVSKNVSRLSPTPVHPLKPGGRLEQTQRSSFRRVSGPLTRTAAHLTHKRPEQVALYHELQHFLIPPEEQARQNRQLPKEVHPNSSSASYESKRFNAALLRARLSRPLPPTPPQTPPSIRRIKRKAVPRLSAGPRPLSGPPAHGQASLRYLTEGVPEYDHSLASRSLPHASLYDLSSRSLEGEHASDDSFQQEQDSLFDDVLATWGLLGRSPSPGGGALPHICTTTPTVERNYNAKSSSVGSPLRGQPISDIRRFEPSWAATIAPAPQSVTNTLPSQPRSSVAEKVQLYEDIIMATDSLLPVTPIREIGRILAQNSSVSSRELGAESKRMMADARYKRRYWLNK